MKNLTIEQLAEALKGKLWVKGDLKRIYLDKGYNTKKMSTKTYVYQREDGTFGVSCYIDCPSQPWNWIKSQQDEIIERVEESIEAAIYELENPGADYYEDKAAKEAEAERAEAIRDFLDNVEIRKEYWAKDYGRALESIADKKLQQERFDAMTESEKQEKQALEDERKSILGQPGTAKRSKELKQLIDAYPTAPTPIKEGDYNDWILKAASFEDVESYVEFRLNQEKEKLGING